jgi:hypothetical protein
MIRFINFPPRRPGDVELSWWSYSDILQSLERVRPTTEVDEFTPVGVEIKAQGHLIGATIVANIEQGVTNRKVLAVALAEAAFKKAFADAHPNMFWLYVDGTAEGAQSELEKEQVGQQIQALEQEF